jgi:hypothetical protein
LVKFENGTEKEEKASSSVPFSFSDIPNSKHALNSASSSLIQGFSDLTFSEHPE